MASLDEVMSLILTVNQQFTAINNSVTVDDTRRLIIVTSQSLLDGDSWGNASAYIQDLSDALNDLRLVLNTEIALDTVEDVNTAYIGLKNYYLNHWWQFKGDSKREPIATLPQLVLLT